MSLLLGLTPAPKPVAGTITLPAQVLTTVVGGHKVTISVPAQTISVSVV